MKEFYTVAEVAAAFGLSKATIRKWIYEGRVEAVKNGQAWLVPAREFKRITGGRTR